MVASLRRTVPDAKKNNRRMATRMKILLVKGGKQKTIFTGKDTRKAW